MSEITFETKTIVRLGKKIVGEILECQQGFFYKVKGNKAVGEIFPTLAQCKQSLEPEEPEFQEKYYDLGDWAKGQMGFGS